MTYILASVCVLLSVVPVSADTLFSSGEYLSLEGRGGNSYVAGVNISVNQGVDGDVYALGNTLNIDHAITGDIGFVGDSLNINADVNGDARFIGTSFIVNGNVAGEVMGLSELLVIKEGTVVSGDVNAVVTSLIVEGTVEGDVRAPESSHISIYGKVNGSVYAEAADDIVLHPGAEVTERVLYTEGSSLTVDPSAVLGGSEVLEASVLPDAGGFDFLVTLIAWIVSGLAAFFLFRKWWVAFIRTPFRSDSPAVNVLRGWVGTSVAGFGFTLLAPVVSIVLLLIPGLYPLILPLLGAWLFLIMLAAFCLPVIVGTAVWGLFAKRTVVTVQSTAVGAGVLFLLHQFMPFIGFLVGFLAFFFLIGTCLSWFLRQLR